MYARESGVWLLSVVLKYSGGKNCNNASKKYMWDVRKKERGTNSLIREGSSCEFRAVKRVARDVIKSSWYGKNGKGKKD